MLIMGYFKKILGFVMLIGYIFNKNIFGILYVDSIVALEVNKNSPNLLG